MSLFHPSQFGTSNSVVADNAAPGELLFGQVGQSNGVGYGFGGIDALLDFSPGNVWQYSMYASSAKYNQIIQASEPLEHPDKQTNRVGFGLTLGKLLANAVPPGKRVILVPACKGATSLNNSAEWRPGNPGAPLYENFITACNTLISTRPNCKMGGFFFSQGERDSNNNIAGTVYDSLLLQFIDGLRSRIIGAADTPFVMVRMVPEWVLSEGPTSTADEIDEVHRGMALRRPYVWVIDPVYGQQNSTTDSAQTVHYNAIAQRQIGESLYNAFFKALKNGPGSVSGAPSSVQVSNPSSTSARVTWAYPTSGDAYAYKLEIRQAGTQNWTTINDKITNTFQYNLTGLTASTNYEGRLTGLTYGAASTPVSFTFATTAGAAQITPTAPTGLTVTGTTTTTASLSWTAPVGYTPTDYVLQYRVVGATPWQTFNDGVSTATTGTVTGLTSGTSYDFQVAAVVDLQGPFSNIATGTTQASAVTPNSPTNLTTGTTTLNSVALSWTAPASGPSPTDYKIEYRVVGATPWNVFNDGVSTNTSTVVTGLTSGTSYEFQVSSVVDNASAPTTIATASTLAPVTPNAPTNLTVGTITANSVALSWTAPGGAAPTDYQIESSPSGANNWTVFNDGVSTATNTIVTGLNASTAYDFRVAAKVDLLGPYSNIAPATTSVAAGGSSLPTPFWRVTGASNKTLDGSSLLQQWDDTSGNGRNLSQSNSANRMSVGTLNGVPYVQGAARTGTSTHLAATFPSTGSYTKLALVMFDNVTTGTGNILSTTAAGNGSHIIFRQSTANIKSGHNGTFTSLNATGLTLQPGVWYLLWLVWDSATSTMTLYNGSTQVTTAAVAAGNASGGTFLTNIYLNNYGTGSAAGNDAKYVEAGVWNVALTQAQIETERARLAALYGISV